MNHREQFHGVGRVLYKGGICLYLALIGLLLGAPLGIGQSRGATLQEIEAGLRNCERMLVEINKGSNYVAAQRVNLAIDVELDGRSAKYDAQAKKLAMQQEYYQKEEAKWRQYCGQLDQERQRLLAAQPPPSSTADAIARSVAEQNNLRHNINFLMKLEAQSLDMAQVCKPAGDQQGYIAWMKKKDALTAQIVKYQGALRQWENIEKATRQTEGQKEDLWKKFEEDRKNTVKDLEGMGKSNKSYK